MRGKAGCQLVQGWNYFAQDAPHGLSCAVWGQVDWKQVDPLECTDGHF